MSIASHMATPPPTSGTNPGGPGGPVIISSNSFTIIGAFSPKKGFCFFINQTFAKGDRWKDGCATQCECQNPDINQALFGECKNTIDTCNYYPKSACQGDFLPWARAHCALRCGLCENGEREPCYDGIAFCDRYDTSACTELIYFGWARTYCRHYCNICDS
ncbi:hypothetical protein CHS0354_015204 [Potamilus streckersoni]|uniref:Uncharacterized protein n=1 Tax=Potamilus streckersoni TaxID=2493646 RepID=A0AAE0VUP5_9BIVA|nr:hypothetical protein CHS0354_015204 [Potamilus streckersoni]